MPSAAGRRDRLFHCCFHRLASIEAIFEGPTRRQGRPRDSDSAVLALTHPQRESSRLVQDRHSAEEASPIAEASVPVERLSLQAVSSPVAESIPLLTGPGAAATG